jgi:hypothetical protein
MCRTGNPKSEAPKSEGNPKSSPGVARTKGPGYGEFYDTAAQSH